MSIDLLDLSSSGIEFHSLGAATANALSPYVKETIGRPFDFKSVSRPSLFHLSCEEWVGDRDPRKKKLAECLLGCD